MARTKYVCSLEFPNGKEVPMTVEEEAQRDKDEAEHDLIAAQPRPKTIEQELADLKSDLELLKSTTTVTPK
jgi:hypothetical protein